MPTRAKPVAADQPAEKKQSKPRGPRGPYTKREPRNFTEAEAEKERAAMLAEFDARVAEAEKRMEKVQARLSVW